MSMQILTVRQFMEIFLVFGIYSVITLLLPAIVLYQSVCRMRFSARFIIYQTAGNCYIIYLVLVLRRLHICGRLLLGIFTLLPVFAWLIYIFVRRAGSREKGKQQTAENVTIRYAGRIWFRLGEILLLFITASVILAAYDGNTAGRHGYNMSDITTYNNWIYEMGNAQDTSAGMLPGVYSVIYYLHTVFGLDDFMLFRAFWIVQTLLLYFVLLAFLRLFCKFRYTAYIGTGIYLLVLFLGKDDVTGGASIQLQEFGMIFILASAAFLFLFFERKKQELEEEPAENVLEETDGSGEGTEQQVYLLDEVLAQTAAREADRADKIEAGMDGGGNQETAAPEMVLIMEENEEDGTFSIKECPLDGTISIKDTSVSIDEIAEHASEDIPLIDMERERQKAGKENQGIGGRFRKECGKDSTKYLVFFVFAFGMALSVSAVQAAAAGVFFIAVCAGYCFRLFRISYLWRILLAGCTAFLFPAAAVLSTGNGGMRWKGTLDLSGISTLEKGHLIWKAVYSWIFHAGGGGQNLSALLSIVVLVLLAVVFFIAARADYGARLLSIALYMAGLTLFAVFFGPGMLNLKNEWECILLYHTYAFVIAWGLCTDGILRLLNGCFNRLMHRRPS